MAGQNGTARGGWGGLSLYGGLAVAVIGASFYLGRVQGEGTGVEKNLDLRISILNGRIAATNADQDELEQDIKSLRGRVETLNGDVSALEWRVDAMDGRNGR